MTAGSRYWRIGGLTIFATTVADSDRLLDTPGAAPSPPAAAPTLARNRAPRGGAPRPGDVPLQVAGSDHPVEREADRIADAAVRTTPTSSGAGAAMTAPRVVQDVLRSSGGAPLDAASREFFEPRLGHDLSDVRIHAGGAAAASAHSIHARAYTVGEHVVVGEGPFVSSSGEGRELLAHELAHVVQDRGLDRPGVVHRRVEMRDVGRGEQSGFARLPELVDRLNGVANGLVFRLDENNDLQYVENPYGTLTEFERRMKAFIDSGTPIRLRLTNKSGLLQGSTGRFTETVDVDDFSSGYVDIDDLLSADDLALQTLLVHFITERSVTKDYTRRIGTDFSQAEFDAGHAAGIDAETQVLRDFFQDTTIRFVNEPTTAPGAASGVARVWTNSRRDLIRAPFRRSGGLETWTIEVRLVDGRTMTAAEYRDFLAGARAATPTP